MSAKTHLFAALVAVCLGGNIATAEAHTKLLTSLPAAGAQIASPTELTLTFDHPATPVVATLKDVAGHEVAALGPVRQDNTILRYAIIHPLAAGKYELSFRVTAADAHVTAGTVAFTVIEGAGSGK